MSRIRAISGSESSSADLTEITFAAGVGAVIGGVVVVVEPFGFLDKDCGRAALAMAGRGGDGALAFAEEGLEAGFVVEAIGFEDGCLGARRGERVRVCLGGSLRAGERERVLWRVWRGRGFGSSLSLKLISSCSNAL